MADEPATLAEWGRPTFRVQLPQPRGSWSSHVLSWPEQRDIPVRLVRYEDLHGDPGAALTAIGRHLGLDPPAPLVAAAVDAASFPRLKAQETAKGSAERPGDWRSHLTAVQVDRIHARHGTVMERIGYL